MRASIAIIVGCASITALLGSHRERQHLHYSDERSADGYLEFTVNLGVDPDGDALTLTSVTQPTNGTITFSANGTILYTPNTGFIGTEVIYYVITDPFGAISTGTITFTVTGPVS